MEVDSSSSDNLCKAEVPKQAKLRTATLCLKAEPEVETYPEKVTEGGQIYLGDSALLRQWLATLGPMRIKSGKYEGSSFADIYSKDKHYANCLGRYLKLHADESRSGATVWIRVSRLTSPTTTSNQFSYAEISLPTSWLRWVVY
eukprot:7851948-Pyramimonas_sp.AAC.1